MKTLFIGIGNPILNEGSAAFRVAQLFQGRFNEQQVTVSEINRGWFGILGMPAGYEKVTVINSIQYEEWACLALKKSLSALRRWQM